MSHWARRRCSRISHGEWGKPFGRVPRRAGGKSFTAASKSTWAWSLWRSSVTRCSRSAWSLLVIACPSFSEKRDHVGSRRRVIDLCGNVFLAKIALDLEHAVTRRHIDGAAGEMGWRELAAGDGWSASDVICTAGPRERAFEEEHPAVSIAVVLAGTFQYRSSLGRELLSPGSLMLGNEGQRYECSHDHGTGDRCVLFRYNRAYLDRLGVEGSFGAIRVPPLRPLAPLVAKASAGLAGAEVPWEALRDRKSTRLN